MSFASVAGVAGLAGAGMSLGSGIAGLIGGSSADNVQLPQMFQMPNMGAAANNAFTGIGNLPATQYGQQFLPQYEQATQNLYNNPYAQGAQQGAVQAGQMGQAAGQNAFTGGLAQQQAGMQVLPYAQNIAQTAFDPQNALYARTLQQLQDQTRASEAARGVAMSPYGAGVENKALSDFNIDWQGTQLGRQATGAGAIGSLLSSGGNAINQGAAAQSTGANVFNQGSAMPYNTAQGIGQGQQQAISSLFQGGSQAQGLAQAPIQDYMQYLGLGNQAGGVANQLGQLGLNQAQLGFNQGQTLGSNVGAGLAGLGNKNNWSWLNSGSPGGGSMAGGPGY